VGIDLVAMSVNDCLCAGAEPLIFLDYIAMSRDDSDLTAQVVKGISDGCIDAECSLIGGETAILPEFYQPGEYDLAGFCLGVVERKQILDGKDIRKGDKVIGLASSGLHSNGYSLARKIALEHAGLSFTLAAAAIIATRSRPGGVAAGLALGLAKELLDARPGGSGFDPVDLAAGAAGTGLAVVLVRARGF